MNDELLWVLMRAFGTLDWESRRDPNPNEVWRLARDLDIDCRIGWRVVSGRLADELGEEIAGRFVQSYHAAAVEALLANAVAKEISVLAHRAGIQVIFLKSNALLLSGTTAVGARRLADIDVLVLGERYRDLQEVLRGSGFSASGSRDGTHQLSPLLHPSGLSVEVHTCVSHMRLGKGRHWVSARELQEGGWLESLSAPEGYLIPRPEFLAGHAIIHAVVQHWRQVGEYPLLRAVGDLLDLAGSAGSLDQLAEATCPWLARERALREGEAVVALAKALTAEGAPDCSARQRALESNFFLQHTIASMYNMEYRTAVRAAGVFWVDGNRSALVALARKVRNRLILDRKALEARYGPAGNPLRLIAWRIWRPFDLARKAVGFVRGYLRYRFTRGGRGRGPL